MAMSYCTSSRVQRQSTGHVSKNSGEVMVGMKTENNSCGWTGNLMLMMELIRKKILVFRDTIDIPPCNGSSPIHELVMGTVEDLHNLYPNVVSYNLASEMEQISLDQGLYLLYNALKCVGDSWAKNHKWICNLGQDSEECLDNISLEQLGRKVLEKLKNTTDMAKEIFDMMDEDEKNNNNGRIQGSTIGDALLESYSDKKISCPSPNTTASIPPQLTTFDMKIRDFANMSYSRPLLLPLRLQALGNLKPNGMKSLSFNKSPPPTQNIELEKKIQKVFEGKEDSQKTENLPKLRPSSDSNANFKVREPLAAPSPLPSPPPLPPLKSSNPPIIEISVPSPPPPPINQPRTGPTLPPIAMTKVGIPPPPPPIGVAKLLRPKKANNKLKRSSQMANLYRILKGRVEGSSLNGKHSHGNKSHIAAGGKQGMADALAEMTKRSAYFQQIEEDVQKHSKSIMEIKAAMNSFQTKDMAELIRFHKYMEQHLEKLTDETQVLARFEGFPTKKLESLRTAAALYMKLKGIIKNLESWKVDPPLGMLLDKVESYFNKIKGEIDALDRSKDEDSKRFQSHNIHFDFNILVEIKESMVDVSSSVMELALEEKRKAKEAGNVENESKLEGQAKLVKLLWRAFQLAFRVYSFAGGQDDRAEMLTKELALEIETIDPDQHH